MIRAIIIEDEISSQKHLGKMLCDSYDGKIKICDIVDTVTDAINSINKNNPDLLFLDIELRDGLGFEILNSFKSSVNFEVIFTSAHIDYRERAMDYFAFYFLNKPISPDNFKRVIDKYLMKKSSFDLEKYLIYKSQIEKKKTIALPQSNGSFHIVNLDDLLYCEADGSYTIYYTSDNKKFVSSNNLKKVESLLANSNFYRISRSILLNINNIKAYETNGKITLINNKKVSVSVRNKKGFFKILRLMNYTLD